MKTEQKITETRDRLGYEIKEVIKSIDRTQDTVSARKFGHIAKEAVVDKTAMAVLDWILVDGDEDLVL